MTSGEVSLGAVRDTRKLVPKITTLLEQNFGYTDPEEIGSGSFGVVFKHQKKDVAVKCVPLENVREGEIYIWSKLVHCNIVPLFRIIVLSTINVVCFEMPACPKTLMTAVQEDEFVRSSEALLQLRTWLYQVLHGLSYLHNKSMCHLELKGDNIFLSRLSSRAMIADFSFLNQKISHIKRHDFGLPCLYQPPETSCGLNDDEFIDGIYFDLWSYGIMAFEFLTGFHILQSFNCCELSIENRFESIRSVFQTELFTERIKTALPAVAINDEEVEMAVNFVQCFMKIDPPTRMGCVNGMNHKFLGKGDVLSVGCDPYWNFRDTQEESTIGEINNDDMMEEFNFEQRDSGWFRRCCSSVRRFLARCMPCMK